MPKISILIASYNAWEYIKHTLQSILDQTCTDFELLIIDNASTDATREYIRGFDDSRITLFESVENLGPYGGLNYLLERAKGEYIAIQDHDDIWHPEKLAKQVEFLDRHPKYLGCGCTMVMYYEVDRRYFEYSLGQTTDYALHPAVMYRNRPDLRYDTTVSYMADVYFLKYILCGWEKKISNLSETLALHIIKGAHGNYSYRWFQLNFMNIRRLIDIHGYSLYTFAALIFEIKRKVWYPLLNRLGAFRLIAQIERVPFRLLGNRIHSVDEVNQKEEVRKLFAYLL